MLQLFTDTSANLPVALTKQHHITVVPFSYTVDGKETDYPDDVDFDGAAFYGAMRRGAVVKTSMVNPDLMANYFERALSQGDDVLYVGMSGGISGTAQAAVIAAGELTEKYPARKIVTIDTYAASLGEGLQVLEAARMIEEGKSLDEIKAHLLSRRPHMCQFFTVDDLAYLKRGGRISSATALIGTVLSIKPILCGDETGHIVSCGKVRGMKRAYQELANYYDGRALDKGEMLGIAHADNEEGAQALIALLREKGYNVKYFYGGNSYFDNMETFFSGNGYDIVDQRQYAPEEITFANIWGVCDEDAYRKVIRTLNEDAQSGKPFFAHVMTVSNHRPFTYPAGKISIPHDSKSRNGGVMYTDYALGEFFAEASRQPWFDNTIFLVTADHCASSAGRTEIPLNKYHIPALIYAPGFVEPQCVDGIVSQIDLMPTLLSLLNMSYDSHFFGRSIYDKQYVNRAFIATYQDLGYLEGDVFTILSPVRRFEQYRVVPTAENPHNLEPMEEKNRELVTRAVGYYQTSGEWNKR